MPLRLFVHWKMQCHLTFYDWQTLVASFISISQNLKACEFKALGSINGDLFLQFFCFLNLLTFYTSCPNLQSDCAGGAISSKVLDLR